MSQVPRIATHGMSSEGGGGFGVVGFIAVVVCKFLLVCRLWCKLYYYGDAVSGACTGRIQAFIYVMKLPRDRA